MMNNQVFIILAAAIVSSPLSIYNNARLVYHAIGPKFHLREFEGIDPSQSIEAMEITLGLFIRQNQDLSDEMRDRISRIQKSLGKAKTRYWTCIGLVNYSGDLGIVDELALQLSQDLDDILFIGGHYIQPEGGSLGGHTATYEVVRQENGKFSFIVNNTVKIEKYHEIDGDRIRQLVYTDLESADLDAEFWKNVIQTNYMNPVKGAILMDAFYDYLDRKLFKGSNKTAGRSFKRQEAGVCAWKSISVWLHGKLSPGTFPEDRVPSNELVYLRFKRFMFEKMLGGLEEPHQLLKAELERKIQKYDRLL